MKLDELESTPLLTVQTIFNKDRVDLIKKTICQGASDDELKLFLMQCERTGLDPFSRQIYSIERKVKKWNPSTRIESWETKRTTQISIDGFRLIAQRSNKYAGQKPTEWCGKDGVWKNIWTSNEFPFAARVGVLRKDFSEPLYAIAKWDAYALSFDSKDKVNKVQTMWAKMPDHMIAKTAEALALRKAFPQELAGLYSSDEMSEATPEIMPEDVINVTPEIKDVVSQEIYEATNDQKKVLVDTIHKFGIEKIPENYKWFSDKVFGCKMTNLYDNIATHLHDFKQFKTGAILCQE